MKSFWVFIATIFLWGCSGTKKDDAVIRVHVLRGPTAIALAEWWENSPMISGRSIQMEIVDSPEQMQAILIKGETDVAALPMINAANLYNKGIKYTLAGCPVWGNIYLVGKNAARQLHVFGAGTTPDILTRYHIEKNKLNYSLNYTLQTASEITRGLLSGKVDAAVLGEPFVSMVLRKDSSLHILADLNNPGGHSPGFAETAILFSNTLKNEREEIDKALRSVCLFSGSKPLDVIRILENEKIFPTGMLTPESIERCKITYLSGIEAQKDIESFLEIIYKYEPKSIGGKIPDNGFYQ